ncbi:MAG: hypothetical protein ACOYOT_01825 [Bacteroidales bacterium]
METWSRPPLEEYEINFFVDTNILSYLVDNTYPLLNDFLNELRSISLVNLISSEYVLLEFLGIRKREHYIRESLSSFQSSGKRINVSSLLKYHNQYSLPEIDFHELLPEIKKKIDGEKESITTDFGISFNCKFHDKLYNPTSEICLSTKISKEDSLVLVSSIIPLDGKVNENVIILTNDSDFPKWYSEVDINHIFKALVVPRPTLQDIKKIGNSNGRIINLTDNKGAYDQRVITTDYLKKVFLEIKNDLFLGETFTPRGVDIPCNCITFDCKVGRTLFSNIYVTIVGGNFDFIYTPSNKITFWSNGKPIESCGFEANESISNLSFVVEIDDTDKLIEKEIIQKLKEPGNLIIFHPHNV